MTRVVSVRVPSDWEGRVTSADAREWVLGWLRGPKPIHEVPPGPYKLNLRLSGAEISALKGATGMPVSSAIRGVLASHISASGTDKRGLKWLVTAAVSGISLFLLFAARVGQRGGETQ
jgi:hypothetical protein